jgi:predicted transcriptional regulator
MPRQRNADRYLLVTSLAEKGLTVREIAEQCGLCTATVRSYCRQAGLLPKRQLRRSPLSDIAEVRQRVAQLGATVAAATFGVSRQAIHQALQRHRAD